MTGPVPSRLLTAAALAPSSHNTQPWRFSVEGERITILPDPARRLPVVDPGDHALYISLGCAVENVVVAARGEGYPAEVDDTRARRESPCPHGPPSTRWDRRRPGERPRCGHL